MTQRDLVEAICGYCYLPVYKALGHLNRAQKQGACVFCDRWCFGAYKHAVAGSKTKAEYVAEKKIYDAARLRGPLREKILAAKKAYFRRTYDPKVAAEYRKKRMHLHVEYCRRPEYVEWKAEYDKKYCAKERYGEFWESAIIVNQIGTEILSRITRSEIAAINGTQNKSLKRKRDYDRLFKNQIGLNRI